MSSKITETSLEFLAASQNSLLQMEDVKESNSELSIKISQEIKKSDVKSEVQSLEHSSLLSSVKYGSFNSPVSSTSNKIMNSTSRKRKLSVTESDYANLYVFPEIKSTGHKGMSSFLIFLYEFQTNINFRCKIFCWNIGKARDFFIAMMVKITLSEACLKYCFDISDSTWSRGRRSLPIEKTHTSWEDQPAPSCHLVKSSSQVFPHTPNHTSRLFCKTDQTPYSPPLFSHTPKRLRSNLPFYNLSELTNFKSDEGFIDSHCHLDFLFQRQGYEGSFKDYMGKHKSTFPDCYKGCLAIFCNPHSFNKKQLWQKYLEEENVWASFGCHPHNAKDYNDEVERCLRLALEHPKVRAVGEIGLDYSNRNNCLRTLQHEAFKRQLKIALEKDLPLVIHCRDAHEDGLAIMKEIVPKEYFIHLHCFTDTWELACEWMQEFPNLFIGITNVVTFPSAEIVHEVAKKIPLERLLLETDAPYFVPKRLHRSNPFTRHSHPGMAIHVAAQIAALKGDSLRSVLHYTRQNTKKIYKI